jgi:hypothetical protein
MGLRLGPRALGRDPDIDGSACQRLTCQRLIRQSIVKTEELLAMSSPRRVVETIINGLQDPLNQHLIKLIGFEFTPELRQVFQQECEAWLDRIQRLRLKPHNRPGTFKFYYDLLFDYPFGGVEVENMQSMMDFIARRYPGMRPTKTPREMVGWLRAFHTELAQRLSEKQPVLDVIPA